MLEKLKGFLNLNEEDAYDQDTDQVTSYSSKPVKSERTQARERTNVVSFNRQNGQRQQMKLEVVRPTAFQEGEKLADNLLSQHIIVLNLTDMVENQAEKLIDFLSGVVYAMGGDVQKVQEKIFICAPEFVEIQTVMNELTSSDDYFFE